MKVKLRDILTPVSRAEPVESEKKYRILGVKWYAKGAWVKDEKYGADIKANSAYRVQEGDLIYNRLFAWKGSFAVISKDLDGSYVSNEFPALRCNEKMAYLDYVFLFLSQYDVWTAIDKLSTGVASISRKRLKVQELLNIEILLLPKNIQQKIINKYSQIDSFYSQLIKLQDKNAVFVKKLRQAILQLAVQGKLAPQDPNDEPASELLKRIKAEKEKLITEGKIKKQKPLPPITEDKIPYELPNGWEWVRLGELGEINPRINVDNDEIDVSFIPMKMISEKYGTPHSFDRRKWAEVKKGFTYFMNNDVGLAKITPCFENGKSTVFKRLLNGVGAGTTELHIFRQDPKLILPEYVLIFFKCPKFLNDAKEKMTGTAGQKRVPRDFVRLVPFPLPSISEQKRIVAKVDQLMNLCDELETRLNQSKKDSEMLMQAVLYEAFS